MTPAAWRVCLKRNNSDNNRMALDISNHQYLQSHFSTSPDEIQTQKDVLLLPLPDDVWNEEKQELSLGREKLQLSVVQPVFSSHKMSCPEMNNGRSSVRVAGPPKSKSCYNKEATIHEVLLRR